MSKNQTKISKEKTFFVAKCIGDAGWMGIARSIYFKCCLISNTQPRYKQFCIGLDFHFFQDHMGYKVLSNEQSLDFKYLDNVLRELFRAWKKNPFSPEEVQLIRSRGIGSGIQVLMNAES